MPTPLGFRSSRNPQADYTLPALAESPAAPVAAYSVCRQLVPDYSGPIMRVRRGSDDEERDLYGDGRNRRVRTTGLLAYAGTNLLGRTNNLENALWGKSPGVAVVDDVGFSTVTISSASGGAVRQEASIATSINHTFTVELKAETPTWIRLRMLATGYPYSGSAWVRVDTATLGTVSYTSGTAFATAAVTALADGWVRATLVCAVLTATTADFELTLVTADNSVTDTTGAYQVRRPQMNYGNQALPYTEQPTGPGGDLRVVRIYDQLGDEDADLRQTDPDHQPQLVVRGRAFTVRGFTGLLLDPTEDTWLTTVDTETKFRFLHADTGGTISMVAYPLPSASVGTLLTTQAEPGDAGISIEIPQINESGCALALGRATSAATVGNSAYTYAVGTASGIAHLLAETNPAGASPLARATMTVNGLPNIVADGLDLPVDEDASAPLTLGTDGSRPGRAYFFELGIWDTVDPDLAEFRHRELAATFGTGLPERPRLIVDLDSTYLTPNGNALLNVLADDATHYVWSISEDFGATWTDIEEYENPYLSVTAAPDLTCYRCRAVNRYGVAVSQTCRIQHGPAPMTAWSAGQFDPLCPGHTTATVRLRRAHDSAEQDFTPPAGQRNLDIDALYAFAGRNGLSNTHDIGGTNWSATAAAYTTGQPLITGALEASLLIPAAGTASAQAFQNIDNLQAGSRYTLAIDAKSSGLRYLQVTGSTGFETSSFFNFDLQTGDIRRDNSGTAYCSCTPLGDGWFRIAVSILCNTSAANSRIILAPLPTDEASRLPSVTFDGVAGVLLGRPSFYGDDRSCRQSSAMKELPYPVPYERIVGAQPTRSLRVVTIFDQSGAARHQAQATTTKQPTLMLKGGIKTRGTYTDRRLATVGADVGYGRRNWPTPATPLMYCGGSTVENTQTSAVASTYNFLHQTGGAIQCLASYDDTTGAKWAIGNKTSLTTNSGVVLYFDSSENTIFNIGRINVAGTPTSGTLISETALDVLSVDSVRDYLAVWDLAPQPDRRLRLWRDGYAETSCSARAAISDPTTENAHSAMSLGVGGTATSNFHRGVIDRVRIWSTIPTEAQIGRLLDDGYRAFSVSQARTASIIRDADNVTAAVTDEVEFTVTTALASFVGWELSIDAGETWARLPDVGETLSVTVTADHDGYLYRAIAVASRHETRGRAALLSLGLTAEAPTIVSDPPDSVTLGTTDVVLEAAQTGAVPDDVAWEYSDDGNSWTEI